MQGSNLRPSRVKGVLQCASIDFIRYVVADCRLSRSVLGFAGPLAPVSKLQVYPARRFEAIVTGGKRSS